MKRILLESIFALTVVSCGRGAIGTGSTRLAEKSVQIEGYVYNGQLYLRVPSAGKTLNFLLDSGASGSLLISGSVPTTSGQDFVSVPVSGLQVEASVVNPSEVNLPTADFPVNGIIGMSFLSDYAVGIDYSNHSGPVTFWTGGINPGAAKDWIASGSNAAIEAIPLTAEPDRRCTVNVTVGGSRMDLELDTGSNTTTMPMGFNAPSNWPSLGSGQYTGYASEGSMRLYVPTSIRLGSYAYPWRAVTISKDVSGLFSLSAMGIRRTVVDFKNHCLYVSRPKDGSFDWNGALNGFFCWNLYTDRGQLMGPLLGSDSRYYAFPVIDVGGMPSSEVTRQPSNTLEVPPIFAKIFERKIKNQFAHVSVAGHSVAVSF